MKKDILTLKNLNKNQIKRVYQYCGLTVGNLTNMIYDKYERLIEGDLNTTEIINVKFEYINDEQFNYTSIYRNNDMVILNISIEPDKYNSNELIFNLIKISTYKNDKLSMIRYFERRTTMNYTFKDRRDLVKIELFKNNSKFIYYYIEDTQPSSTILYPRIFIKMEVYFIDSGKDPDIIFNLDYKNDVPIPKIELKDRIQCELVDILSEYESNFDN